MKKHTALGISFAEMGALLATRELLKQKILSYRKRGAPFPHWSDEHIFDMSTACRINNECGSVSCIGGTMALVMGMTGDDAAEYVSDRELDPTFGELFFPKRLKNMLKAGVYLNYEKITPQQAVTAINNFLKGKKPWPDALKRKIVHR